LQILPSKGSRAGTPSASWGTGSTTHRRCARRIVSVSVDTAVDIAKESADMILLEKSLFGTSSSFGNMFSVLGVSIFVPYLPMTPIQILTNKLLSDVSQAAIPTDNVDPEQIATRRWDTSGLPSTCL
jgi:P-type Mg2+ transporter